MDEPPFLRRRREVVDMRKKTSYYAFRLELEKSKQQTYALLILYRLLLFLTLFFRSLDRHRESGPGTALTPGSTSR